MVEPIEWFHKIISEIPEAIEGKMFGALCIYSNNGKAAAIFWENNMIFKLSEREQESALRLDGSSIGSHLYAPDKPMKGWVLIPSKHSDKWTGFTRKAIAYTKTIK